MKHSNRQLKLYAREALKGNYSLPILSLFILFFISVVLNQLTLFLFHANGIFQLIIEQIFSFIISLILSIFTAGVLYMHMNIARNKPYSLNDLLYLFRNHPDRIIVSSFFLSLINLVTSVPYLIVLVKYSSALSSIDEIAVSELGNLLMLMLGTLLLNLLLYMLLTLPLSLTYFLLADHPEMGAFEGFRESIRLMKGAKMKYLLLQLSFIPLILLSSLTCYIGLLWVLPYMRTATTMFYLDLCGQLNFDPPVSGQLPQNFFQPSQPPRMVPYTNDSSPAQEETPSELPRNDDYNSEA